MDVSRRVSAFAALAGLFAAAGCGGDPGAAREIAALRARADGQAQQVSDLERRLAEMESRNRLLEERLSAARPHAPSTTGGGPARPAAPAGDDGDPSGTSPADAPAPPLTAGAESVLLAMDAPQVQARVVAIMEQERRRREEEERTRRRDEFRARVREQVFGELGNSLGLTDSQRTLVENVFVDGMERASEIWQRARDGGGGGGAAAMEEMRRIRSESEDQLRAALSTEQFDKLQEQAGRLMGFGGRGAFGGGFGGAPPGAGPGGRGR